MIYAVWKPKGGQFAQSLYADCHTTRDRVKHRTVTYHPRSSLGLVRPERSMMALWMRPSCVASYQ